MDRRNFVEIVLLTILSSKISFSKNEEPIIFNKIIEKARKNQWNKLPIKQLFYKVALEFLDFPYIGGTLDKGNQESCVVTFDGFDCVTFFEVSLNLARIIKKDKTNFADLVSEVTFSRYREGTINDYTSRLHYSADWIYDNIQKGVVRDRTKEIGGIPTRFNLDFMSSNPHLYNSLRNNSEFIAKIEKIEREISMREYYIIPRDKIETAEPMLESGDIVFFATNRKGLDYSHVGICLVKESKRRLLHASSKKKKVILDTSIFNYVQQQPNITGITVVEPLEIQ
ncbi:MAG: hypothetical protein CH6_1331 [Candidatus Kapaibacterium sp.]|nr:MAG: hypothetical protein CH6_1331 [Candidatus Kapabacteria bacterium]